MRLFLYYTWESMGSKRLYTDVKIFQGDYLSKRGNSRFKVNNLIFDLLDSWKNNLVVENTTANSELLVIEPHQFAHLQENLIVMEFMGRKRL